MKAKIIGAVILIVVIACAAGYYFYGKAVDVTVINGYLGGEKIGIMEDEQITDILAKKYHIAFDYSRAGSLDMVTADQSGRDYLFPSSRTALEYYKEQHGEPVSDEIIFNTPIVLYSHKAVAEALMTDGTVTLSEGVYYADMKKLTDKITSGVSWAEAGLPELYGNVSVDTTDPVRSNSGNMFAALLANVLCGGKTADEESVKEIMPQLKSIFADLGYMETSSSDLFNQFIRTGIGAKPIIAGYENQLLEYAAENPEQYKKIAEDIVIIYPTPTLWSTHIYIALDETGKQGAAALCDEKVQQLAWEKHGFRTSGCDISSEGGDGRVAGIAPELNAVINMPDYKVMKIIMEELEE
ncbi:hypothetical protein [Huintestinicola sp.]|uniref:hypothetical protein n=1 Tax=Huintestinicola sp. TaxID=2981661 RepID=UPI003D7D783A